MPSFHDFLPHRGHQLIRLGMVSVLLGGWSWMPLLQGLPALVGIPLSWAVWIKARGDLGLTHAGVMDRAGMEQAAFARQLALLGLLMSLSRVVFVMFLVCSGIVRLGW